MQGRITKVLNMKPPEILAMIEEAVGTMMFETKKQQAQRTIEKKDAKLREINDVTWTFAFSAINILSTIFQFFLDFKRGNHANFEKIERRAKHVLRIPENSKRVGTFVKIVVSLQVY